MDVLTLAGSLARRALETWGSDAQRWMAAEEAAELILAVARHQRGRASDSDVLEEAADAVVIAVEAAVLVGYDVPALEKRVREKLGRLADRLNWPLDHFGPGGSR